MVNLQIIRFDKNSKDQVDIISKLIQLESHELFPKFPPTNLRYFKLIMTEPERPTRKRKNYLIYLENTVIGYIVFGLNKISDVNQLSVSAYILPEYRKIGYLKMSLAKLQEEIPDYITIIGTHSILELIGEVPQHNSLNQLYEKIGGKAVYNERISASDLTEFNLDKVKNIARELSEKAKENGYTFLFIEDYSYKNHPELNYEQFLQAVASIWNDMPVEEASWEEEPISDEIYSAIIQSVKYLDGNLWQIIAIDQSSGLTAGLTDIYYYKDRPGRIMQGDTGVTRDHRGKGLGRTLKYMMLERILTDERTKEAKLWITGNASSNQHMLKINEELNYEGYYQEKFFEIPIDSYLNWLKE
jgi:GNAT superfamily N-acetyltransferase